MKKPDTTGPYYPADFTFIALGSSGISVKVQTIRHRDTEDVAALILPPEWPGAVSAAEVCDCLNLGLDVPIHTGRGDLIPDPDYVCATPRLSGHIETKRAIEVHP